MIHQFLYNLDFIFAISFSSFIANAISPLILSLPDMKAAVGLSSPANILVKSALSMVIVHWGSAAAPLPTDPDPFLRSTYHSPSLSPSKMKEH